MGYLSFDVGRVVKLPLIKDTLAERILPEADVHRIIASKPNARKNPSARSLLALHAAKRLL